MVTSRDDPQVPLKILLTNSTDIFAGGEDYVLILSKYLIKRGHSVRVSANPGHLLLEKCGSAGIPTLPINYVGMGRVFAVAAQLRKALRLHAVDIVHSNANYDRTCAAMAAAFAGTAHIAGVHSAHSIRHNLTHWLRNRWGTDHFIADAEAVKDVLTGKDRIPASAISVIPIGVENDPAEFRRQARARTRAALCISPDTIVIGNVARLVPFKGHSHLLEAAEEVVRRRTDVLFTIIGDGELRDDLQRQASERGLGPYLRFLGFRSDLQELYPAFDLYCHSSLDLEAEAFPIAILRALAAGLPVVCTDVGGIRLMVEDGKSGYLRPSGNPGELARALLAVMEQPELRRSMGEASFALFLKKFHAAAMAENVERVYAAVLAARGHQAH